MHAFSWPCDDSQYAEACIMSLNTVQIKNKTALCWNF